jgi:hypothetical protein
MAQPENPQWLFRDDATGSANAINKTRLQKTSLIIQNDDITSAHEEVNLSYFRGIKRMPRDTKQWLASPLYSEGYEIETRTGK